MDRKPPAPPKQPKDPDNPSAQFGRTYAADYLRKAEIESMLATFDRADPVQLRNRALIVVLWRSGLRVSEALALRPIDIDMDALTIRVLHGKGDKARTVGIDPGARAVLVEWLRLRATWAPPTATTVFCTTSGARVLSSYVRAMLPRVAAAAGVQRRVHPHIFRHTYAVELVRERVPVPMIQRLLGHSSLATTTTYLASLAPEDALDMVRGREW